MKLYKCNHCGNVAIKVYDMNVPLVCCGEKMSELVPNTVEAAVEKHIPILSLENNVLSVKVGSVAHPMLSAHYITSIFVVNGTKTKIIMLNPADKPEASFIVDPSQSIEVYEYCNLHGLWSAKL